jgi:hypothetical protein
MKDNFSAAAGQYARYRPHYPRVLFDHIVSFVKQKELAWDCATGNGQSAFPLAGYFSGVYATDISTQQLEHAQKAPNIIYAAEPAEKTTLQTNAVDLVTVSQALHWLDFDKFYAEVKRVGKKEAVIAAWGYSLLQADDDTNAVIGDLYFNVLGGYWDEERKYVDDHYAGIPFPFERITSPDFFIRSNWTSDDLEGYLNTWSALKKYIAIHRHNPVKAAMEKIGSTWRRGESRPITFPVHLKMGRVH